MAYEEECRVGNCSPTGGCHDGGGGCSVCIVVVGDGGGWRQECSNCLGQKRLKTTQFFKDHHVFSFPSVGGVNRS